MASIPNVQRYPRQIFPRIDGNSFGNNQGQYSKQHDAGKQIVAAEKAAPVHKLFVNAHPDEYGRQNREGKRCQQADQPWVCFDYGAYPS